MWKLAVLPAFLVAFLLVALFTFYRGVYTAPPTPDIAFTEITSVPTAASEYSDEPVFSSNPVAGEIRGQLLIDDSHRNNFYRAEIGTLLSRVTARGYVASFREQDSTVKLATQLSQVDALIVVLPTQPFNAEDIEAVVDFVETGGKLLLVGDPGRFFNLNELSEPLGISFQPDYLYNQVEYDTNFRDIFVRDFQADSITTGLGEMVFYYAGSLKSAGPGLTLTDSNTRSTLFETDSPRSSVAIGAHRNVLAVYDLTFMIPPYSGVKDNGRLVSNIADFLTEGGRNYRLADFPRFFQGDVDILVGEPDLISQGARMKQVLGSKGITSQLRGTENVGRDTVFLSLFDNHASVSRYLEANGVRIGETLATPFASGISLEERSVMLLDRSGERDVLVIVADTSDGLGSAINLLNLGTFRNGLVDDITGVFETR